MGITVRTVSRREGKIGQKGDRFLINQNNDAIATRGVAQNGSLEHRRRERPPRDSIAGEVTSLGQSQTLHVGWEGRKNANEVR